MVLCKFELSISQPGELWGDVGWGAWCSWTSAPLTAWSLRFIAEFAGFAGVLQSRFVEMRGCREALTEQELPCTAGRKAQSATWLLNTHLKDRHVKFLSPYLCKDNRSTPEQPPPCFRQCSGSGKTAQLDFVNDQIFGCTKSLLAVPCWKTFSSMGICWQGSGERRCFAHAHLFSHKNKSTHYWLFIIPPSNKLSAIQAAGRNSNTLLCAAHHTSWGTDNEWANQTSFPKTPAENYSAQWMPWITNTGMKLGCSGLTNSSRTRVCSQGWKQHHLALSLQHKLW